MIRVLLALSLLLIWPGMSPAQTLTVRSGEHADFTRLVVYLGRDGTWTLTRDGAPREVLISFDRPGLGFDLDRVFDLIPRDRLAGISSPGPSVLRLQLACDCPVAQYPLGPRYLVLDIFDPKAGPVDAGPQNERGTAPAPVAEGPAPAPQTVAPEFAARSGGDDPADLPTGRQAALPLIFDPKVKIDSSAFAQMLDLALQESVTSGLLAASDQVRFVAANSALPNLLAETGRTPRPDDAAPDDLTAAHPRAQRYCPAGAGELLAQWAGDQPYAMAVSDLRAATIDSTGRLLPAAQLRLAQFQVAHGLGIEALVNLRNQSGAQVVVLRAMANILELRGNIPPSVFQSCPGFEVWEALRQDQFGESGLGLDEVAVVQSFRALPEITRSLVQDRLLNFLHTQGYAKAHGQLTAYLERTSDRPPPPAALAPDQPLTAVESPSHGVAEALLARFETLSLAAQTQDSDRALLDSFRTEHRGTQSEPAFWAAALRARLVSGDIAGAIATLAEGQSAYPALYPPVFSEFLTHVTDKADDIGFLRVAMALGQPGELPPAPPDLAPRVTARLAELGF